MLFQVTWNFIIWTEGRIFFFKFLHGEDGETIWPNQEIPWKFPKRLKNYGRGQKN